MTTFDGLHRPPAADGRPLRKATAARPRPPASMTGPPARAEAASVTASEKAAAAGARRPSREVATTTATASDGGQHQRLTAPAVARPVSRAPAKVRPGAAAGASSPLTVPIIADGRPKARMRQGTIGSGMPAGGRFPASCDSPRYPRADARSSVRPAARTASSIAGPGARDRSDRVAFPRSPPRSRPSSRPAARSAAQSASSWLISSETRRS